MSVMERLLRSPRWHRLAGRRTVLLEIRGHRSGRVFSVPVSAVPDGAGAFVVRSRADRVWWRNLRGGAEVGVWIGGVRRTGTGTAHEDGDQPWVSLRLD